ncbi:MAG: DUF4831 family protein [Bacteroidaceae bacterium]|nr:DUF4831 family protein [Bacteroidaceae bacterium]
MATALPLAAQTEVSDFRPGVTLDGVNYFLPKTKFQVILVAEKAVTTPGEFAAYSDRYLRQPDVPITESTTWTLKSITLRPFGVPDSTKAYSIRLKAKTSAPLLSLADDGLLLSINAEAEPEPAPSLPQRVAAPKPVNGRDFMTHEILSAGSTAKMAQLTAEEIYEIRDSRNALVRGEADNTPKDGAQLKLMLDNLDQQLFALESLFKGQTLSSTEVLSFEYEPTGDQAQQHELLCRFSRRLGLVESDDLSGEPLWITITPSGNLPQRIDDPDAEKRKQKMEQGVWVNVPASAKVKISTAEQDYITAEVPICQWGTTEVLSEDLFNKRSDTHVTIFQHTGNVKRLWQE